MKNRTGFVSNSSSASFIVSWINTTGGLAKETTVVEALCDLFEVPRDLYNKKAGKFRNVPEYLKTETDMIMELKKLTKKDKEDGFFKTEFFTTMMNSGDDFGELAKTFLIDLVTCENCGIVNAVVDSDNY